MLQSDSSDVRIIPGVRRQLPYNLPTEAFCVCGNRIVTHCVEHSNLIFLHDLSGMPCPTIVTRRPSAAFLKQDVARTPAGHVFVSQAEVAWHRFTDAADLGRQVQRVLAEHLLHHATHYALTLIEVEQLEALRATEAGKETEEPAAGEGAGSSAVILSRERFVPREGVVVNDR